VRTIVDIQIRLSPRELTECQSYLLVISRPEIATFSERNGQRELTLERGLVLSKRMGSNRLSVSYDRSYRMPENLC